MHEIYESAKARRALKKLPREILMRYEKWKDIARLSGISGLKAVKGFHDESLKGQWKGFRSSRLGQQYRVIYHLEKTNVYIEVVDINSHDYRRK